MASYVLKNDYLIPSGAKKKSVFANFKRYMKENQTLITIGMLMMGGSSIDISSCKLLRK